MSIKKLFVIFCLIVLLVPVTGVAQDLMPEDNGLATYHTSPRYRPSESHPLRVLTYVVHPIGWVFREVFFRPFSYFASSTRTTRSVLGYREPFDYRQPECFSADDSAPDCRAVLPFNYDTLMGAGIEPVEEIAIAQAEPVRQVYFPDVNFDFDIGKLNTLGRGKVQQVADLLNESPDLQVVLEGHTDFKGTEEYNEALGINRAEAVRQALVDLGVSPERLSTVTFGKSQPALGQKTDWARAVNRRVEVHVGGGDSSAEMAEAVEEAMVDEG